MRAAVLTVDRDLPITQVETMESALSDSVATERLTAIAAAGVRDGGAGDGGGRALRRDRVHGRTANAEKSAIRVALGADAGVGARGWWLARPSPRRRRYGDRTAGAADVAPVRCEACCSTSRPRTGLTYAGAMLALFAATALAAVVVPARRALRVDPLVALRAD